VRQKAGQHRGAAALGIEKKSLVGYLSAGTRTHTLHVAKHRPCHAGEGFAHPGCFVVWLLRGTSIAVSCIHEDNDAI
jgi:hypothetical protein